MPEGDTIHRAADTLRRALVGRTVTGFDTAYAHLARVNDDAPLAGRTVEDVRAAGKHLLMTFSGGLTLHTHMRMNGSWHIYRPGERWQRPGRDMRVVIETDSFVAVGFSIPVAEWLDERALARQPELRRLGPDLLDDAWDADEALRRFRADPSRLVGDVVLDQRVAAGAGNVYRSEVMFLHGLAPLRTVGTLSDETIRALLETTRKLLRANIANGSSAIVTYTGMRRTTGRADPGERLWVYGRGGRPCRRCGTPIQVDHLGAHARIVYHCPRCQR
jgi:endonuclease VIII